VILLSKIRKTELIFVFMACLFSTQTQAFASQAFGICSAQVVDGNILSPAALAIDGNENTEFVWTGKNNIAEVVLDLGAPWRIEAIQVVTGLEKRCLYVDEIEIGPKPDKLKRQLGRKVNLAFYPKAVSEIPLKPVVGRYVKITLSAGEAISEIKICGRVNYPERHFLYWANDIKRDYLDKIDYLDKELGATDLWLDWIASPWQQSVDGIGFEVWEKSGALQVFKNRGMRYWLSEHEAFATMVNSAAVLENELAWQTTYRMARQVYINAKRLGFTGIVMDAEVYYNRDAWSHEKHFGPQGLYYQRGYKYGKVLKSVWDCELIQLWEGRMFSSFHRAGAPLVSDKMDFMQGNYWWLKGLNDAGVRVSMALEKTYGAGFNEINAIVENGGPSHIQSWLEGKKPDQFVELTYECYPFLYRVIPGFHPWQSCNAKAPCYLPKYLDEQLSIAEQTSDAYWIYTEGAGKAGDPRELDQAIFKKYNIRIIWMSS